MEIELTQGKIVVIDDADWTLVAPYKWHAAELATGRFYASTQESKSNSTIRMHRLIARARPGDIVDHVDGDPLNNVRSNLRTCGRSGNNQNSCKRSRPCSSQFKGVLWSKRRHAWQAQITVERRTLHLGYFDDETSAARAYNTEALRLFGEFAWLNRVPAAAALNYPWQGLAGRSCPVGFSGRSSAHATEAGHA